MNESVDYPLLINSLRWNRLCITHIEAINKVFIKFTNIHFYRYRRIFIRTKSRDQRDRLRSSKILNICNVEKTLNVQFYVKVNATKFPIHVINS